jgi:twitching motility two-component system response regulator PilH
MWGMRQGARAYLTKPFSEDELSDVITSHLSGGAPEPSAA